VRLARNEAELEQFQLGKIGLKANLEKADPTDYYGPLETKGTDYNIAHSGWCADYFDPFDFINVNFDGRSIQPTGNVELLLLQQLGVQQSDGQGGFEVRRGSR